MPPASLCPARRSSSPDTTQHVAWGFTNLGADVQDLYIEHTRGTTSGRGVPDPRRPCGSRSNTTPRVIEVRGGQNVVLDVPLTHHGTADTPIISSLFPNEKRSLSLRWTIYDPACVSGPVPGRRRR